MNTYIKDWLSNMIERNKTNRWCCPLTITTWYTTKRYRFTLFPSFWHLYNNFQFTAWVGKTYWLGLNDLHNDGDFRWEHDGEAPGFSGWGTDEPNGEIFANCVVKGEHWWNDIPCSSKRLTVCEFWQLLSFSKYTDQCFWIRHLPFKQCCRYQYIFAEKHLVSSVTRLTKYFQTQ